LLIEYSNLNDERKIFLNRELADILYLCRKQKIPIPEINLSIIDSTNTCELHQEIKTKIKISVKPGIQNPDNVLDFCEQEKNLQTSQSILNNNILWIIGTGAEGAIYGFYNAIKKITGVKWYGISDSDIGFTSQSDLIETIHRPKFPFRGVWFTPSQGKHNFANKFLKWMVRNGWNLININAWGWDKYPFKNEFIKMCDIFGIKLAVGYREIEFFLPDLFFQGNLNNKMSPCYSNPQFLDKLADGILDFVENHPEIDILSLQSYDESNNRCQCEGCLKKTPYEAMYMLGLEIKERIKRFLPIEILCPDIFSMPYKILPISNNTYTLLVVPQKQDKFNETISNIPETKYSDAGSINFSDKMDYCHIINNGWLPYLGKIGSAIGICYHYQDIFHTYPGKNNRRRYLDSPNHKIIEDEINKFAEMGISVFYDCSLPFWGFWPDEACYSYLGSLLWENSQNADKTVAEYYRAIGGERAEVLMNILKNIKTKAEITPSVFETAKSIFRNLSASHSCRYLLWLDYIQLVRQSQRALQNHDTETMVEKEKQIIVFFEKNRDILEEYIDIDYMISYSKALIDFYSKQEENK